MTVPALCHPTRPNIAKGLCTACYQRHSKGRAPELDAVVERYEKEKSDRTTARAITNKQRANQRRRGEVWRDVTLRKRYGITAAQYDTMLKKQHGACFICKEEKAYRLVVDHCHKTGRNRALLYHRCNTIVGVIESDTNRLAAARKYLSHFK